MENKGKIIKISGPLVIGEDIPKAKLGDICYVGNLGLIGEIIKIEKNKSYLQIYEETSGLKPGEPIINTYEPLSIELGPGLLGRIFDGLLRPLDKIFEIEGEFIQRGNKIETLDKEKEWEFVPTVKENELVSEGDILGYIQETSLIKIKIMVPLGIKNAKVKKIFKGLRKLKEPVAILSKDDKDIEVFMYSKWPVKNPRPLKNKLDPNTPLFCGQRIIDAFFPLMKGGKACVPGPFGSGKTVIQHQLAKFADTDIIIFVGCGERGNEMADVLDEFPHLIDPKTGKSLMERTILIANTSNMPIAAREASVYVGVTLGEYFRDMGYDIALMIDSTSRWAEALREISSRLEEMPGEEGYPAYLSSRISAFYERAGIGECLGKPERIGSLSIIGAVSPPGGDLSEPVTQATLRITKVFWSLDEKLAAARHFPAINWLRSYSLYLDKFFIYLKNKGQDYYLFAIQKAMELLSEEAKLLEILRLVGFESLTDKEKLILETSSFIREDFLMQNAFDEIDAYSSFEKQSLMLSLIIKYYQNRKEKIEKRISFEKTKDKEIEEIIKNMRYFPENKLNEIEEILNKL